jgi:S-layer homology domain
MASLLTRALDLPDGRATFSDVPPDHPHARGIAALATSGITGGCAPERFCPGLTVNRGQMASFLVRALDL